MKTRTMTAVDLGASGGRVLLARFDGLGISLEEIHRFHNRPVTLRGHRFWNILDLWDQTLTGLRNQLLMISGVTFAASVLGG